MRLWITCLFRQNGAAADMMTVSISSNQWIVNSISTNPKTGEPYATRYWSTYKEEMQTQMDKEWQERFNQKTRLIT